MLARDQKYLLLMADSAYSLRKNINLFLSDEYQVTEFTDEAFLGEDKENEITLGLRHKVGDVWRFSYSVSYDELSNDDQEIREYEAYHANFNVSYRFR